MGETLKNQPGQEQPEPEGDTALPEQKVSLRTKIARIFSKKNLGLTGALLGIAFLVALAYAWRYPLLEVDIAGQPVNSSISSEQLAASIYGQAKSYRIPVDFDGKIKNYKLSDGGIAVDAKASAETALAVKKPDNPLERLAFWQSKSVELKLNIDEQKLDAFVAKNLTKNQKPAQDASLAIKNGKVVLTKEKEGRAYTLGNPKGSLLNAAANLRPDPIVLDLRSIKPKISPQDIGETHKTARALLAKKVVFDISGQLVQATPADIGRWVELTPVESDKTIDITVNSGKVLEYLNQIAAPYVHPPRNSIKISQSGGQNVLIPGEDGVDIVGKKGIATRVARDLLTGSYISEKLAVKHQKHKTVSAKIHPKWVVVDLTYKRLYAYEKDRLVKTFLVSAGTPETPTVEGQYEIYRKYISQDMYGANTDGSRYYQPNVQYVNYFHQDYAIHGNDWRPLSWFGSINSSHGCVGIINPDAEWIYNWAPIGTPVYTFS